MPMPCPVEGRGGKQKAFVDRLSVWVRGVESHLVERGRGSDLRI